jgi:hypothetical protein
LARVTIALFPAMSFFGSKPVSEDLQAVGLERRLGQLGQVLGRDDLVGVDVERVENRIFR